MLHLELGRKNLFSNHDVYFNLFISDCIEYFSKAWFPLNVSLIATNQSCLLARTLLRFAGFHKQPSFGLLRGLLYLEACKLRSASGLIRNYDFPKVVIVF